MNPNKLVKSFFNQQDKELLNNEENLLELHRRVSVFYDALWQFDNLHGVFTESLKGSPYKVKWKNEYIRDWARGYIWELLYENADVAIPTAFELKKVQDRLTEILSVSFDKRYQLVVKEIKEKLFYLLETAYPSNTADSGLLKIESKNLHIIEGLIDIAISSNTTIDEIFDIWEAQNLDHLIFDCGQVRDVYLNAFYAHYLASAAGKNSNYEPDLDFDNTDDADEVEIEVKGNTEVDISSYTEADLDFQHYSGDIERFWNRKISKEELIKIITGLVSILQTIKLINSSFESLNSELLSLDLKNPDFNKIKNIEKGFKEHIANYNLYQKYEWYRRRNHQRYIRENDNVEGPTVAEVKSNTIYKKVTNTNLAASWGCVYRFDIADVKSEKLEKTLQNFDIIKNIISFDKAVRKANYRIIERSRLEFWAKWAFLEAVDVFVKRLQKHSKKVRLHCEVICPQYSLVHIKYYKEWLKTGELDTAYFRELYNSFNWEKLIVRSSAVNSEDNEGLTGAGVYLSEVCENKTFSWFCEAITKVYQSCNSEIAKSYRDQNNISEEYMWLIIQRYVDDKMRWNGQVNTIVPYRPDLLEILWVRNASDWFRPILNKEESLKEVFRGYFGDGIYHNKKLYYFKIDWHKHDGLIHDWFNAAKIAILLERYFWKPIQVEFVAQSNGASISREITINTVQARILPSFINTKQDVEFPQEWILIWRGRALGSCDETYEVLTTGRENNDKVGVVSFGWNHQASMNEWYIRESLPGKGAVILRNVTGEYGHIETICIEKNLPCLFDDSEHRAISRNAIELYENDGESSWHVRSSSSGLFWFKKVRVVVNWLEWRVYGVEKL